MSFADPEENLKAFGLEVGMEVADLGAGPGHYSLAAAKIVGDKGHVCAVEIQKDLVEKVKSEADRAGLSNLDVVWGDLEKPEGSTLKDRSVDAIILSNVLFQTKDKPAVLEEAYRILRPQGKIMIIDWSDSYGGLGPPEDHLVSRTDIEKEAEKLGFIINSSNINPGAHHWGLILQKQ